jgi:hypothetical protein
LVLVVPSVPGAAGETVIARPAGRSVAPEAYSASISRLVFIERCRGGCVLTPGTDDARFNMTSLVSGQVSLSEFPHGDPIWDETIECLREVYAPYDVSITTADPGSVKHHKAILAGTSEEAGHPADFLGVGLLNPDCSPLDNVVSLTFAGSFPPDARELCKTAAQEIAHAFGLDHVYDCHDVMTHLPACGPQYFRGRHLPCGELFQRECQCTGNTQNGHQKLIDVLGEGSLPEPPALQLDVSADDGVVDAGFSVVAVAQDRRGIDRVELLFNGWLWDSLPGDFSPDEQELAFTASSRLPDGYIDVEVKAHNDLGSQASEAFTVLKGRPCSSADQCLIGQLCENGRCFWPPPERGVGDRCDFDEECISLWCASHGSERRCSEPCATNACENGFECVGTESGELCWPRSEGGCSVGARRAETSWVIISLLGLVLVSFFRSRSRARR